jgi:hypothetical protein
MGWRQALDTVRIGNLEISKFILGSNPLSGFSHQSIEMDSTMRHYFSSTQSKRLFRDAEALGVTAIVGRSDHHVIRLLMEYWDEGGKLKWLAQTCTELGSMEAGIDYAVNGGASGCHLHGGIVDYYLAQGRFGEIPALIERIRAAGLVAGIAGHNPQVFRHALETGLDVDYYMCCYYNPTSRDQDPAHKAGACEWFYDKDREIMVDVIAALDKPVVHYKVMAAGRNDPAEAFKFAVEHMRPDDSVCVGIYDADAPGMLRHDGGLFEAALKR